MGHHWPLPPSAAPVWGKCSGSVQASAAFPNLETQDTREGTAAHWVFSETALAIRYADLQGTQCAELLGAEAPNGVVIDEKMCEGPQHIIDNIQGVLDRHGRPWSDVYIEQHVAMPFIHPDNQGTLDAALYIPGEHAVLYVWDYKHGRRQCDAGENLQLIDYTAGLADKIGINDLQCMLVLRIVQPFCYTRHGTIDGWACKLSDIRPFVNILHAKAHEAQGPDPLLTTGSHCRDCPAVGTCAAARAAGHNAIDVLGATYEMDTMPLRDLATERELMRGLLSLVKGRIEAIEGALHHRIGAGEVGSDLTLESSTGNLAWTCPPKVAAATAAQFGFDITVDAVRTPTQALQDAPVEVRHMFKEVLKGMASRPSSGLKLSKAGSGIASRAFTKAEER